jgi:hypothetical protein
LAKLDIRATLKRSSLKWGVGSSPSIATMKFTYDTCELCKQDYFDITELKFYQVRNKEIQIIECNEQPWSGVYSLCYKCLGKILKENR